MAERNQHRKKQPLGSTHKVLVRQRGFWQHQKEVTSRRGTEKPSEIVQWVAHGRLCDGEIRARKSWCCSAIMLLPFVTTSRSSSDARTRSIHKAAISNHWCVFYTPLLDFDGQSALHRIGTTYLHRERHSMQHFSQRQPTKTELQIRHPGIL
jgi:hypothetical protein